MPEETNQSHATHPQAGSVVPEIAQEKLPEGVEQAVPDTLHDTQSSKDHSTGHSYVPKPIAESLPKAVEEAVPDAIHDTSAKHS